MKTGTLFELPKTAPSKTAMFERLTRAKQITEFKRRHGILTYRTPDMRREHEPWCALLPTKEDSGKRIGDIVGESGMWYENVGRFATGTGELSVIRKLCKQCGIKCDL